MAEIRIVLVGTRHPGNIGATARAMKTMGLAHLFLVTPKNFPSAEATARAANADNVLQEARICANLPNALADCGLVIGTTARSRHLTWPTLALRDAANLAITHAANTAVAFVFGSERTGLTNEELDSCQYTVTIPTNADYSSLNLAAAVQIITYELHAAQLALEKQTKIAYIPAPILEMERLYQHIEQTLIEIEFLDPALPRLLMRRLRRIFNRAQLDLAEVNLLRGVLSAMQRLKNFYANHHNKIIT